MSQATDNVLRKSLDEIDGIRKAQTTAFVILFCVMISLLVWLGYLGASPATDVRKMILLAVAALFVGMIYVVMAFAMVQSKMTLKVLKAIELLSRQ
jgi:quinol-cytochrome oxidoreductase complex cytochrome b subunit